MDAFSSLQVWRCRSLLTSLPRRSRSLSLCRQGTRHLSGLVEHCGAIT